MPSVHFKYTSSNNPGDNVDRTYSVGEGYDGLRASISQCRNESSAYFRELRARDGAAEVRDDDEPDDNDSDSD